MLHKGMMAVAVAVLALGASAAAPWSDTPVTCHWIGAVKAGTVGTSTRVSYLDNFDFASWTNAANWVEGIVPGMYIDGNGVTNGCKGCTAVFDQACTVAAIDLVYGQTISISNVVVSGSTVPKIVIGRPWIYSNPYLFIESGGGVYVDSDVVTAPVFCAGIKYMRDTAATSHNLYFENNSSTPLRLNGFHGIDTKFASWKTMSLVMRGTGCIRQTGLFCTASDLNGGIRILLDMDGGKFVQEYTSRSVSYIGTGKKGVLQHLELPSDITLNVTDASMPLIAEADLLIDGGGTLSFTTAAGNAATIGADPGKTLTLDCAIARTSGGSFKIGHDSHRGGTVVLAAGRSLGDAPISFNNTTLQISGGETFASAMTLPAGCTGTIVGGLDGEAKITGGVSGATRSLTLKGKLAVASDITATTTLAADAEVSFRKAASEATAFTISTISLSGDKTILVEDGVTATVGTVIDNGYTLDIRPEGTGKVVFSGLSAGMAPAWLRINGSLGVVSASGELVTSSSVADDTAIDAHGGVVPDSAGSVVAVTTANGPAAENVTLAVNSTSVMMLRQRQAVDNVQVDMSAGQTLSAGVVSVLSGAKPLTVGSAAGVGSLAANGDMLELETVDASSRMIVNAAVEIPANKCLVKEGAGEVVFAGPATGLMEIKGGSLVFTNGDNGVTLSASNATMAVAGSVASRNFNAVTTEGTVEMSGHLGSGNFVAASNGVGCIEMTGGCVTGGLSCAANNASYGTFRMTGGELVNPTTGNYQGFGYAYTKIDGGICRMTIAGGTSVMPVSGHNGVFEQTGGEFRREGGSFRVGGSSGALGVVCIKGGEFHCTGGDVVMPNYNGNASGILTVEGDNALFELDSSKIIHLACVGVTQNGGKGYGNTSMVNLNGGKLIAKAIARCGSYSNIAEKAYVNFNGGTFTPANYIQPFGSMNAGAWELRLDRVTSFERGATLEVGVEGYTYVPIQAPVGKGVDSVAWTPVSGLPGAPVVKIEDPDGTGAGASAFADVDDYGTITNVHVTSPGWNYTRATAKLYTENNVLVATFDCTLKEQVSGGFTKTGNGTFTFYATNTYTGATVLKNGTLKLGNDDVINSRSALVLSGGTLDLDGHSQTFSSVSGNSGSVVNGTFGLTGLVVDVTEAVAGRYPTVSAPVAFAPGAEVTLANVDAAAPQRGFTLANFTGGVSGGIVLSAESAASLPGGAGEWKLVTSGSRLKLVKNDGIMIIVF